MIQYRKISTKMRGTILIGKLKVIYFQFSNVISTHVA